MPQARLALLATLATVKATKGATGFAEEIVTRKPAEPAMPAVYKNLGIQFDYPENWKLDEEEREAWPRVVSVQTAESAFWMLQIHAAGKPRELAAESFKTMQEEYEGIESDVVTEVVEGTEFVGFDLRFYCYDFLVTAQIRSFIVGDQTMLLLCQGEDRDFDKSEPVFRAMTTSLLRNHAGRRR